MGSPKILIFGESGGRSCPFILRSGINHCNLLAEREAQVAELVDALVSNTNGKPCRFDPGPGY